MHIYCILDWVLLSLPANIACGQKHKKDRRNYLLRSGIKHCKYCNWMGNHENSVGAVPSLHVKRGPGWRILSVDYGIALRIFTSDGFLNAFGRISIIRAWILYCRTLRPYRLVVETFYRVHHEYIARESLRGYYTVESIERVNTVSWIVHNLISFYCLVH